MRGHPHIRLIPTLSEMPANYPSGSEQRFEYHSGSFVLEIPDETVIRKSYQQAIAAGENTAFPYWARIWPAALGMADYLDANPALFTNKKVIEFAAGLGLPSLLAAGRAATVLTTDYLPQAIAYIERSIAANGFSNMKAALYNWHTDHPEKEADLVLLSDTNYDTADQEAVEKLIRHYLETGATVLLTTPHRLAARELLQRLDSYCRDTQALTVKETTISIYRYSK